MNKRFYVDKGTGTFADQLTAFGLASVMRDMLHRAYERQRIAVTLKDQGGYYQLDLELPLDEAALARIKPPYVPVHAIRTRKNADKFPTGFSELYSVNYEEEKDKRARFFDALGKPGSEPRRVWRNKTPGPVLELLQGLQPHHHWDIFRAINPGALAGYNKLVTQWWQAQDSLVDAVRIIRDLYAQKPNDLAAAERAWKLLDKARGWGISATATALQLFNPSQGKGQNRPKPDRLMMGNVKGFWLEEWLKAVGFYSAALTKAMRGTRDRKTYVLAPLELSVDEHERIFSEFVEEMQHSETAVRSDILASLRYTRALLRYAETEDGREFRLKLRNLRRPRDVVGGFSSAFYKSLGSSSATMNLPFVGLPGWVHVATREDVADAQRVIEEHDQIVRQFNESHSDEHTLLLTYRDFCSGEDLEAFFAFSVLYGGFIIARRERNQYAYQFTEENLRRLIMGTDRRLAPILETSGFQSIAYAIRQSTVVAQYRKKQGDRRYDVRYGLGQQLARKAHYAQDFIAELSDFLHSFNAENAQVMENREGPYRRSIHTSDIDDIVRLVDEYGSRTVCNLLVAYGYARAAREDAESEPDGPSEDTPQQVG